jgi:hypothetical protein
MSVIVKREPEGAYNRHRGATLCVASMRKQPALRSPVKQRSIA